MKGLGGFRFTLFQPGTLESCFLFEVVRLESSELTFEDTENRALPETSSWLNEDMVVVHGTRPFVPGHIYNRPTTMLSRTNPIEFIEFGLYVKCSPVVRTCKQYKQTIPNWLQIGENRCLHIGSKYSQLAECVSPELMRHLHSIVACRGHKDGVSRTNCLMIIITIATTTTTMGKLTRLDIQLNRVASSSSSISNDVYYPGSLVEGKVIVELAQDAKLKALVAHVKGVVRVHWTEAHHTTGKWFEHINTQSQCLSLKQPLFRSSWTLPSLH